MTFNRKSELPLYGGILILASFGMLDILGSEEPEELILLRQKYEERINVVKRAVTERYISALGRIQMSLNQSGDTDGALMILQERNQLAALLKSETVPDIKKEELIVSNQSQETNKKPTAYDPTGTTWNWRPPAKEITFHKNGRAYALFPDLGEKPIPHYWKKVSPRKIEIWYENGSVMLKFEVKNNGKTGIVKYGDSNAETEVTLITEKTDRSKYPD